MLARLLPLLSLITLTTSLTLHPRQSCTPGDFGKNANGDAQICNASGTWEPAGVCGDSVCANPLCGSPSVDPTISCIPGSNWIEQYDQNTGQNKPWDQTLAYFCNEEGKALALGTCLYNGQCHTWLCGNF